LRAKPGFTLTTSPIWPRLSMRSSRMTSIVLTPRLAGPWPLGAYGARLLSPEGRRLRPLALTGCPSDGGRRGGRAGPSADIEDRVDQPDQHQDGRRPAEHDQQAVEQAEPQPGGTA